ncbi:hypothetical protein Micbo1qcDRAFT_226395 [Microdochium bolleyi]|uniref:Uncharacterized protein n=1 Tax=Microdochium bolleyi TaxID=196109 RepID=A0A136IZU4_9PEZI|nr:hypothetical protein Micbo1qcDRAFT_226395 [Microdochium bolleyi]
MRVTAPTLLALVGTAAAVDVGLLLQNDCNADAVFCTGYNPNTCCGGASWWGASLKYVPRDWALELRLHTGGSCGPVQYSVRADGQDICFRSIAGKTTTGAGYGFLGRKRADEDGAAGAQGTECQRPDLLRLADGTEYSLKELSQEQYDQVPKTPRIAAGNSENQAPERTICRLEFRIADGGNSTEVPEYLTKFRR